MVLWEPDNKWYRARVTKRCGFDAVDIVYREFDDEAQQEVDGDQTEKAVPFARVHETLQPEQQQRDENDEFIYRRHDEVNVLWSQDDQWYEARVTSVNRAKRTVSVMYKEWDEALGEYVDVEGESNVDISRVTLVEHKDHSEPAKKKRPKKTKKKKHMFKRGEHVDVQSQDDGEWYRARVSYNVLLDTVNVIYLVRIHFVIVVHCAAPSNSTKRFVVVERTKASCIFLFVFLFCLDLFIG